MPPATKPPAPDPEPEPINLELDLDTFTADERLECQIQFDNEWSDIAKYLRALCNPWREGAMPFKLFDRKERLVVGERILAYMLWVQAKRTDPEAELEPFTNMANGALRRAHLDGLLGKAKRGESGKSTRSSRRRASSSSSAGG